MVCRMLISTTNSSWTSDAQRIHTFQQYVACSYFMDSLLKWRRVRMDAKTHNKIPHEIISPKRASFLRHGHTMYMFGGQIDEQSGPSKDFYTFNELSRQWYNHSDKVPASMAARYGHYCEFMNDSLVVFGGWDEAGEWIHDAWAFHTGIFPLCCRW